MAMWKSGMSYRQKKCITMAKSTSRMSLKKKRTYYEKSGKDFYDFGN